MSVESSSVTQNIPEQDGFKLYQRLLKRALPYWWAFAGAVVGFVIYGATHPLAVKLMEMIIDSIETPSDKSRIFFPLAIVAVFAIRGVGTLMGTYGMAYVARKVVHELRVEMFCKLNRLPIAYFSQNAPGHLISKITYNAEQITRAVSEAVTIMIREGIVVLSLLGYLFFQNWKLTLILLTVLPPVSLIVNQVSKRFRRLGKSIQNSMGDVTHVSSEVISAYQEVRIYGAGTYEDQRFEKVSANNRKQSMKYSLTEAINTPVIQLLVAIALSVVVWLALNPEIMGNVSSGQFIAFILAAALMDKPIRQLTKVNSKIQLALAASQDIFGLLDDKEQDDSGTVVLEQCRGEITFKGVSFAYAENLPKVLQEVSFEVKAGQTIALVGRSGGGKSSMVSLLPRFYEVSEGKIEIDGQDIKTLTLASLRHHIALVSQKVTLFNNTVYHNIAYGNLENATREKVEQAAKLAYAHDFISALEHGYDTQVGQDGIQLSGGQRQRIAIARALMKEAPIIIMDEATSALDNESEAMIQKALEGIRGNKTLMVIAHRLSTIEKADKILVIDQGRIVEQGKHEELLARNGFYARLANSRSEIAEIF